MSTIRNTISGLRGQGRGWTLLIVAGGWLVISGFRVLLPALLPQIKADFTINNASAGSAMTVLWFVYACLQFPAGIAADRIGERTLLIAGALLAALSFGAFYAAPVFALFLVACMLFGFGAGLFGTPRDIFLSKKYPEADNTAYSVIFAAGSFGAALLPYLAAVIASKHGWRLAVGWLLPLLLGIGIVLWRVVPSPETNVGSELLSVRQTVRRTFTALTDRTVLLASSVMVLFIFTYQALISFIPTYLIEVKGLDQGVAAALFGFLFVVSAVIQPISGHFADQYGKHVTILLLIGLSTGTLLFLPFIGGLLALSMLVPLLSVRNAVPPLASAFIVKELPREVQGTGWGLLRTLMFGLGAAGSTVLGLFAGSGKFDVGLLVLTGLTALSAVLWVGIARK
jgi:predicted MFS family arabinose efflux permease